MISDPHAPLRERLLEAWLGGVGAIDPTHASEVAAGGVDLVVAVMAKLDLLAGRTRDVTVRDDLGGSSVVTVPESMPQSYVEAAVREVFEQAARSAFGGEPAPAESSASSSSRGEVAEFGEAARLEQAIPRDAPAVFGGR